MIGLIDIGIGNTKSLHELIKKLRFDVKLCSEKNDFKNVTKIILPGVGAFGEFMKKLKEKKVFDEINLRVKDSCPILGICVGYQVMFEDCDEFGFHTGFKFLKGNIRKIMPMKKFKVPHVGWNNIKICKSDLLFDGLNNDKDFYFCHSYVSINNDKSDILTTTEYS